MTAQRIKVDVVGTGLVSIDHLFVNIRSSDTNIVGKTSLMGNPHQEGPELISPICGGEQFRYLGSYGGGSACNTLCYLSALGFGGSIMGIMGIDEAGKMVRADLDDFGIGHDYLIRKNGYSTRQYAHLIYLGRSEDHVYSQKCPFCGRRFQESARLKPEDLTDEMYDLIDRAKILHVDRPSEANVSLVNFAFEQDKIISFDFGYYAPFYKPENVLSILNKATIVKTSSHAASSFLKTNQFRSFQEVAPYARIYLNTRGGRGVEGFVGKESGVSTFSESALQCPRFLESGGAGDAFHAGLLYNALEEGINVFEESLQKALDFSQALASLCCMFIGARGYLINRLRTTDFPSLREAILSDVKNMIEGNVDQITTSSSCLPELRVPWAHDRTDFCVACGRPTRAVTSSYYEMSLHAAPSFMSQAFQRFHDHIALQFAPKDRIYVVGSGGSLSVSVFCQLLLNQYVGASAFAMTPYDFLEFGKPDSKVVLISYGGNNPDIVSALYRAVDLKAQHVYGITGSSISQLSRLIRNQENGTSYCVTEENKDRGFVSTIGMLSTMASLSSLLGIHTYDPSLPVFFNEGSLRKLFATAKIEAEQKLDRICVKFSRVSQRHIVALGSGWAWPALIDFDSKLSEGGITSIEISETKNYTHGRYINAYKHKDSRMFVLFSTSRDTPLTGFLEGRLCDDFPIIVLSTDETGPRASVQLMVKQLFLVDALAKKLGVDITRPRFPQQARGLYSWGPIYDRRENRGITNA